MSTDDQGTSQSNFEFVDWGPPPDMRQRELIFDSLSKIVYSKPQRGAKSKANDTRGTYVFTWGAGYHGQLGRKFVRGQKKYSGVPLMIEIDVVVRQVSCGGLHTAIVSETGEVYTWGDGRKGQLGHKSDPSLKQTPRLVEALDNVFITQVACGGNHTVAVSDQGLMYSWGWAKFGQIGHGERTASKMPRKIDHGLARDVVQVACGNKHTLFVNKKGEAFSFGCGEHGQTGLGEMSGGGEMIVLTPTRIESLRDAGKKISHVACGAIHSVLITTEGELYLCGFGEFFHPNESQHFFYSPKLIEMPEPVVQASCGQSHNIVLSVTGNVYTWGTGEYGQLGHGIKGNLATPRLVLDGKGIAQVSAGRYHSFALSTGGVLYSWGCGENGQLGLGADENVPLPTVVHPIIGAVTGQVACGEHHTVVLTSAPWSKVSADVEEWEFAAKRENYIKGQYLKKTHRGLTRKDLERIKVDLVKWQEKRVKELADDKQREEEDLQKEIDSIQYKSQLQDEVQKTMGDSQKFPAVEAKTAEEEDVGRTRFPRVGKKKANITEGDMAEVQL